MKILITGGHVTPALAVIDELQKKKVYIHYVGRKHAYKNEKAVTYEYQEISQRNIPFVHLETGKLTRIVSINTLLNLTKITSGLFQSTDILRKHKPDAILSFGGYLGLPVALIGKLLNIPVFIHEQTIAPGLSNTIIAKVASKIFLSFPESAQYFPSKKIVVTGNPIRKEINEIRKKPFNIEKNKPVVYVTGGSLGAHSLNVHIEYIIHELLDKYIVIHQAGNVEKYGDLNRLKKIKHKNYFIQSHFSNDEIGWVYNIADIIVSRAGANTVFELIKIRKPSVLVPLPWSSRGEQEKHARLLANNGVAEIFEQSDEGAKLLELINRVYNNSKGFKKNFGLLQKYIKNDAAKKIVENIISST